MMKQIDQKDIQVIKLFMKFYWKRYGITYFSYNKHIFPIQIPPFLVVYQWVTRLWIQNVILSEINPPLFFDHPKKGKMKNELGFTNIIRANIYAVPNVTPHVDLPFTVVIRWTNIGMDTVMNVLKPVYPN